MFVIFITFITHIIFTFLFKQLFSQLPYLFTIIQKNPKGRTLGLKFSRRRDLHSRSFRDILEGCSRCLLGYFGIEILEAEIAYAWPVHRKEHRVYELGKNYPTPESYLSIHDLTTLGRLLCLLRRIYPMETYLSQYHIENGVVYPVLPWFHASSSQPCLVFAFDVGQNSTCVNSLRPTGTEIKSNYQRSTTIKWHRQLYNTSSPK